MIQPLVVCCNARMRERDLARREPGAASDECCVRAGVMRGAEGATPQVRCVRIERPADRTDDRHLERLCFAERRHQTGDRPSEERLARAGRPHHQQVVASGERHLERPPRVQLSTYLRKVDRPERLHERPSHILGDQLGYRRHRLVIPQDRRLSGPAAGTCDEPCRFRQVRHADHLDAVGEPRLTDVRGGHHDAPMAGPTERREHRQRARHRPDGTRQRQLAEQRDGAPARPDLP